MKPTPPDALESAVLYDRFVSIVRERAADPTALIETALPPQGGRANVHLLKHWLDSFRPLPLSVVAELKRLYTVRLTYNSNAIEGNTLTQHETEMVLEHGVTVGGKSLVEHLEVLGHRDAMEYVQELAAGENRIGEWEVKNLHALIMRQVESATGLHEAGSYRTQDVRAAGTEHRYPPHYDLPELMSGFSTWLESPVAKALDAIEYASETHYRLVTIHPFRDGNGRTARLLMNLFLLRAGMPIAVIQSERRKEYIDALVHAQSHAGDITLLTEMLAEACRASLLEYLGVLSTAAQSRGKGVDFYNAVLAKSV